LAFQSEEEGKAKIKAKRATKCTREFRLRQGYHENRQQKKRRFQKQTNKQTQPTGLRCACNVGKEQCTGSQTLPPLFEIFLIIIIIIILL